jgi:hypothetical protein
VSVYLCLCVCVYVSVCVCACVPPFPCPLISLFLHLSVSQPLCASMSLFFSLYDPSSLLTIAQVFTQLFKHCKRKSDVSLRSVVAGTLAEVIAALGPAVAPYVEVRLVSLFISPRCIVRETHNLTCARFLLHLQKLYPVLLRLLGDSECEVRSNAAFGMGHLVLACGGHPLAPRFPEILQVCR